MNWNKPLNPRYTVSMGLSPTRFFFKPASSSFFFTLIRFLFNTCLPVAESSTTDTKKLRSYSGLSCRNSSKVEKDIRAKKNCGSRLCVRLKIGDYNEPGDDTTPTFLFITACLLLHVTCMPPCTFTRTYTVCIYIYILYV